MSYVYLDKGNPIYRAKVKLPNGKYTTRSTKKTGRREAEKVAREIEEAYDKMREGVATEKILLKAIRSAALDSGLGDIKVLSIKETFETYLESKKSTKRASSTISKYTSVIKSLLDFLGKEKASQSINTLRTSDIESWRNSRVKAGITGTTADNQLSIISFALGSCKRKGLIVDNPSEGIDYTGEGAEKRHQFTSQELINLFKTANYEWKGMILLGLWYGMRIGDASNLKWDQVNLANGTISHNASKTGRRIKDVMIYSMPQELYSYLRDASKKKNKTPYLFPSLAGKKSGSFGGLSNAFGRLMDQAKIVVPKGAKKVGKGRQFKKKGYHSLKYSQASRMAEAGIPENLAKAISMHSSSQVHQGYVQYTEKVQKALFSRLPSLFKIKKGGKTS